MTEFDEVAESLYPTYQKHLKEVGLEHSRKQLMLFLFAQLRGETSWFIGHIFERMIKRMGE